MRSLLRVAVAFLLAFATASSARGDLIGWSYDFNASTTLVRANASTGDKGHVVFYPAGATAVGTSIITAVDMATFSTASPGDPAIFKDAQYTLTMKLTDKSSGLSAYATFIGVLDGTLSAQSSSLKNHFIGQTEYVFDLNHHLYDITPNSFTPPGVPGSSGYGSISFDVTVHKNPEPTAFVLAGMALPALGWLRRRKS